MNRGETTAILVAGMHRSGTSALAGALGAMGIALGERLLAPGSDNPKGYWEHEEAVAIHERLFASLGRHWSDVRALPDNWQASEAARVASAEIGELISRDFAQSTVWAVKDPRICRFLPLWVAVTKQLGIRPVVLFVARQFSEVAASIEARNHWAPPVGELLWLRHVLEAEAASRTLRRATVIYDDLLADPELAISNALNRLGVQHERNESERYMLRRFVDNSDRHHRHAAAKQPASNFGVIAQTAYKALVDTVQGNDAWQSLQDCAAQFDKLWQTSGATIEAIADVVNQTRLKEAAAQIEILDLSSKLNAQIRWSEEAIEIRSKLQADYDRLQLSLETQQADREYQSALQDRVAGELSSLSTWLTRERDEYSSALKSLTAERDHLASVLESASKEAEQERAKHVAALETLAEEQNRLAFELDSVSARAEQERRECKSQVHKLVEQHDAVSGALHNAQLEVAALNAMVLELSRPLWRRTRLAGMLSRFFRAMLAPGKK